MDFSKIKAITIPEGAVTKITCGGAVLWKKLTGRIPNEYQEVEWIGTDGNSYFVSNFTINALDRFTLYYRYNVPSGEANAYMFGASNDSSLGTGGVTNPRFLHRYKGFVLNKDATSGVVYTNLVHDGTFHDCCATFEHNGNFKQYDDGVLSASFTFCNAKVFDKFGVFCNNYNKAPASFKATSGSKIAELRFVDDTTGNDVFNPVPCYRRADGVIGMYDTVSKTFFTNQGPGSFTKGASVGGYTNLVPLSTEADGVTIYNGGLGYKDGYRVRSGGAEAEADNTSCTGFIPVKVGDVVRLSGYDVKAVNASNAINVSDSNRSNLGQIVANANNSYGIFADTGENWDDVILEKEGVYKWTVPDGYGITYIRVTGYTLNQGEKMIVTVNEEITA